MPTDYQQRTIRDYLLAAGAPRSERKPGPAEILAAIALAESPSASKPGWAFFGPHADGSVTPWHIHTREIDTGKIRPRDREWITESLHTASMAALTLYRLHGYSLWGSYTDGSYRTWLPEWYPPQLVVPSEGIPYREIRLLADRHVLEILKLAGWIAPSREDFETVARFNGFSYDNPPIGCIIKVPNQRGW